MDYLAKVKQQEEERRTLDNRMQTDADLLYLKRYIMADAKGHAVPDIVNVTLNKPAVFAAHVVSALGGTNQQTVVESDDKQIDDHYIEEFQDAAFAAANARLRKRMLPLLNPFADSQLCFRGRVGRRVLFRMGEDGVLITDIANLDGRYLFYEMGQDGLKWEGYKTTREKDKIEAEYGIVIQGRTGEVLDVWDTDHNEVWLDGKRVLEQGHDFGFTPAVISKVSLGYGSILLDKNHIEHEGESIFFMIRDIIPELNRLVSILQTLNLKSVKPPMKFRNKEGKAAIPPDYEDATDSGTITSLDVEGDIAPIDYGEAKQSAQMLYAIMDKAMAEGSITSIDLGNLQFPLSAIALVTVGEGRDQVFIPRLDAKAQLNQQTAEMFTQQCLQIGGTIELGTSGHKRKFNTAKLEGEYETTYKYFQKSPKIDIARLQMGKEAISFGIDRETVYTDIMQYEDPKGMIQKYYYELAEKLSPNVLMNRTIIKLLELAEDGDEDAGRDAQIMALELGMNINQVKTGMIAPPPPAPAAPQQGGMPLLGAPGKVGGIPEPQGNKPMIPLGV